MKKIVNYLLCLVMLVLGLQSAKALTFEEGFKESASTPMMLLLKASWADDLNTIQQNFSEAEAIFGNRFNFVELDIASNDAKAFNSKYHIYPNLPYVLMFRDGGKVTRYIPRQCAADLSCLTSKIKSFIQ